MESGGTGGAFATLTHARLRAAQGDVSGAVRILRVILGVQPEHEQARRLLAELEDRVEVVPKAPEETSPEAARPASARELRGRFRDAIGARPPASAVERLNLWLERVRRNRGERRVR